MGGRDCQAKAIATANALIKRIEDEICGKRGMAPFSRIHMHTTPPLGVPAQECVLKVVGKLFYWYKFNIEQVAFLTSLAILNFFLKKK